MSVDQLGVAVVALAVLAVAAAVAEVWVVVAIDRALTLPAPPVRRRRWFR